MITTDEHIDVSLIPSDYSISFPFDVILYITGYTGIGVLIGAVLAPPLIGSIKKTKDTMKICIFIYRGMAMVASFLIGCFVTLLAFGTGFASSSSDESLPLAITSLLGTIPIYFLWFRKT